MKSGIEGERPEPDSWNAKQEKKQQQRKIFTVDQGYNKTIENKEKYGGTKMKGYYTMNGFFGFADGGYTYYASQSDYYNEMENRHDRNTEFDYYKNMLDDEWN